MSDLLDPQTQPTPVNDARAQAKAAKAYAKAMQPWYKKKRFLIPGAVIALAILGGGLGGGDETDGGPRQSAQQADVADEPVAQEAPAAKTKEAPAASVPEAALGIGDAAKDGKFTFTVHSFDCGKKSVGASFLKDKAQGQFCLMDVTVANHGDEAQMLFSDNQYVYDAKGRQFSHDDVAAMSVQGNDQVWIEDINPGNSVRGIMVFDVPKNADIVTAELHDSMMSGGITVSLK